MIKGTPNIPIKEVLDYVIIPAVLMIGYFLKDLHVKIKEMHVLKERIVKLELSHDSIKSDLKEVKDMLQKIIQNVIK